DPFLALRPADIYTRLMPASGNRTMRRLVDLLPRSQANMSLDFKLRRALMGVAHPRSIWLPVWMAPLDPKDLGEMFESPVRVEELYEEAISLWERDPGKSAIDKALEFFTRFYLQDDILMKVDRASMMCSLESRAVFLDNDLVEFCRRLPSRFKLRNRERKYLLKKVARTFLPASIVARKKQGFGIPLVKWLREVSAELPLEPVLGVRTGFVNRAFVEHRAGTADHRLLLWSWIVLQAWKRNAKD